MLKKFQNGYGILNFRNPEFKWNSEMILVSLIEKCLEQK